jgi:hypothetical protein
MSSRIRARFILNAARSISSCLVTAMNLPLLLSWILLAALLRRPFAALLKLAPLRMDPSSGAKEER